MTRPTPTAEQQAIVDAFAAGRGLAVEAGAGAGKTSTLRMLADQAPRRRGVYREPTSPDGDDPELPRADVMLAYVAVTRTKYVLDRDGLAWIDQWLRPTTPQPEAPSTTAA